MVQASAGGPGRWWSRIVRRLRPPSADEGAPAETGPISVTTLPSQAARLERWRALPQPLRSALDPRPSERATREPADDDPLEGALRAHLEGEPVAVALVGPAGCGRSTRLHGSARRLERDRRVVRIDADRRLRTDRDVAALLAQCAGADAAGFSPEAARNWIERGGSTAVFIDDAERLFPRAVGADAPARQFLATLLEARERHLFVLGFRDWAWRRLDYRLAASNCFTHVVEQGYPDQASFVATFAARMEIAGPALVWADDAAAPTSGPDGPSDEARASAADRFLGRLHDRSRGNYRLALLQWLVAARPADDSDTHWVLDDPRTVDVRVLKDLDELGRFTLVELIVHGGLTAAEHAELFLVADADSRLVLERLRSDRLVLRVAGRAGADRYDVDPALYVPVASALDAVHLLY